MLTRNRRTRIDDERKDYPDLKRSPKKNRPQQLQTHHVPTNDRVTINNTIKEGNLLSANKEHGLTKKGIYYSPAKLDNRLSPTMQDIQRNHILYWEYHGKLNSRTDSRRKKLTEVKIQRGIFKGDEISPLLFVIVVVSMSHILRKCTGGYKLHKSQEKNQSSCVHGRLKTICQKRKRIESLNIGSEDMQWWYRNGMWHRKYDMLIIKGGKREMIERIELPNQEKIRTFGEKETYKYLGILEADTIKQAGITEKCEINTSGERENYLKPNYIAEISPEK